MRNMTASETELLGCLLRDVSRSFYLTLRVLPSAVRSQIGIAYLLARAADSMADTEILLPAQRLEKLLQFRGLLNEMAGDIQRGSQSGQGNRSERIGESPSDLANPVKASDRIGSKAEEELLKRLPECLDLLKSLSPEDLGRVVKVVTELTRGMELDLQRFSGSKNLQALVTFDELEEYTYHVAGCVGPFWTEMCAAHLVPFQTWDLERMSALGIRFGKALQWTNVLRDIPRDLQNGRCYLPTIDLNQAGLSPLDLRNPGAYDRLRPIYHRYLDHALEHYRAAAEYLLEIPRCCPRVRLACVWPIWIGLETLALLRKADNPLDPDQRIRIRRSRVYAIMATSLAGVMSNHCLNSQFQQRLKLARGH